MTVTKHRERAGLHADTPPLDASLRTLAPR